MFVRTFDARDARRSRFDWGLALAVAAMIVIGTLSIISAASPLPHYGQILRRHFLALGMGTLAFALGMGINYQIYEDQAKFLYGAAFLLCASVYAIGTTIKGHRGWILLPLFSVQVVEIARPLLFLSLAAYLDKVGSRIRELGNFLTALLIAGPILVMVLKQPDLSSVLVMFPVVIAMLFYAGADLSHLAVLFGYGAVSAGLTLAWTWLSLNPQKTSAGLAAFVIKLSKWGWASVAAAVAIVIVLVALWWMNREARIGLSGSFFITAGVVLLLGLVSAMTVNRAIKNYQRKRVEVYLSPELDPRGAGYHLLQAQIAIGSGGLWGRGLFSGTQSKLGFLPERHTDFIFAVIGEELGFVGTISVLALYLFVVWRSLSAARQARDRFGYLAAAGLGTYFMASLLVNVGMCLGFLPIAGIPLPFVSYGGSNLVMSLMTVGVIESVYARRYALA